MSLVESYPIGPVRATLSESEFFNSTGVNSYIESSGTHLLRLLAQCERAISVSKESPGIHVLSLGMM